jgi:hypothetical protein
MTVFSFLLVRPLAVRLRMLRLPFAALLAGIAMAGCGGSADAPPPPSAGPVIAVPPTITLQPADLGVTVGQPAAFTVAATGTAPLAYQWQRNGVAIAGATATTFTLSTTTLADSGATFRAVVSNVAGSATSNAATLSVNASAPVLTVTPQPASTSVVAGTTATFLVGGTCSAGTLDIQWQRLAGATFANIAGATAASYSFATAVGDNGAQFRAMLDCSGQSATPSNVANLTVSAPGSLSLDPVPVIGLRGAAQISSPGGITRLPNGDYWYTDGNTIRRLSADLKTITTVAGTVGTTGSTDGPAATALFRGPADLVADATGIVYVLDSQNGTIRRIALDGTVSTIAGTPLVTGAADGTGAAAQFNNPRAIALGPDGDIYVADNNNHAIRRVTVAGVVTTYAGNHTPGLVDNANPANAQFTGPDGIAVAANNDVYISDAGNSRIRRIARAGAVAGAVSTIAGASNASDTVAADGPGPTAGIPAPLGMTIVANTLYVRDRRGLLRAIDLTTDVVSTVTGNRVDGTGNVDGPSGHAQLDDSTGYLAALPGGGFVLTDRLAIKSVSAAGLVTTIATSSTNTLGQPVDAQGVLSQLPLQFASNQPTSIAVDPANNIVTYDAITRSIRRIDPSGNVSLVAGLIGGFGRLGASGFPTVDGQGSGATFNDAGLAIAMAVNGTIYLSDSYGVRRVDPAGNVVQLSGSRDTFGAVNGNAAASRYNRIFGLAVAANGDVFAGDGGNNAIRRIDAAGNSTSYAGVMGSSGQVNGPIATARFQFPRQLAIQSDGTLYTADNGTLRRVSADGSTVTTTTVLFISAIGVDSLGNVYCNPNGAFARYNVDGTVTTLIPASGSTVVTGSVSPNVGTGVTAIAMRSDKQIVVVAGQQLLQVTLP